VNLREKVNSFFRNFILRISIRQKLLLLLAFIFIPLGIIFFSLAYKEGVTYIKKSREIECLETLESELKLISLLQKHRGLTFLYLKGKREVADQIRQVEKDILRLNDNFMKNHSSKIQSLLIANVRLNTSPEENFYRHTHVIELLLKDLQDRALSCGILEDTDPKVRYLSDLALLELPQVSELIGRIRGLGSGFLVNGLNDEEKEKLEKLFKVLVGQRYLLSWTASQKMFSEDVNSEVSKLLKKLKEYEALVESILISNLRVNPFDFFQISSEVQSSTYEVSFSLLKSIKSCLELKEARSLSVFFLEILVFTGFSLLISFLAYSIYVSIVSSVKKLLEIADAILQGNYEVRVKFIQNDEFGRVMKAMLRALNRLKHSLNLLQDYKTAVDESSIVIKTDPSGIISYANKKFVEMTGYEAHEVIGKHVTFLFGTYTKESTLTEMLEFMRKGKLWKGKLTGRRKSGQRCIVDTTLVPVRKRGGGILEFVIVCHDITELEESREKLYYLLNYDSLTGLPNRNKLINDIKLMNYPALCVIDISDFNKVNELFGEDCGDEILKQISKKLKFAVKEGIPYRIQSDEFAILFDLSSEEDNEERLFEVIKRVLNLLETSSYSCDDMSIYLNFYAGIVKTKEDREKILSHAEFALKEAKKRRQKLLELQIRKEEEEKKHIENVFLLKKIKFALANDKIVPYYQPILNNKTGKIEKFEALARMIDEEGKVIPPGKFLPLVKRAGIYPEITLKILKNVMQDFEGLPFDVSVNISFEDLINEKSLKVIFDMLKTSSMSDRLIFEILETEEIESYELLYRFVKEVKSFNCKFAIDDFGTGYSNLENLLKFNVDYLKIDGSIIKRLPNEESARILVEAIVDFSRRLGIKTVAEFVSDEEIFSEVKRLGIDYSQGWYIGKPEPIDLIKDKFLY